MKQIIENIKKFYWKYPELTLFLLGVLTGLFLSFIF
jgi:hypothetical protein